MRLNATFIWVFAVILAAVGLFVYLIRQEQTDITPRMQLSHFADEQALTAAVQENLGDLLRQGNSVWLGIEPDRAEQLAVVLRLQAELQKQHPQLRVIVDHELGYGAETLTQINAGDVIPLKQNLYAVGEKMQQLEKEKTPYLFITAAIYSTSLLPKNPIDILKKTYALNPVTLSMAYFPLQAEDEKNMLFPCRSADDHAGTAPWGCAVVNKARFLRRKVPANETLGWVAYLDESTPRDFMLVLAKKN